MLLVEQKKRPTLPGGPPTDTAFAESRTGYCCALSASKFPELNSLAKAPTYNLVTTQRRVQILSDKCIGGPDTPTDCYGRLSENYGFRSIIEILEFQASAFERN